MKKPRGREAPSGLVGCVVESAVESRFLLQVSHFPAVIPDDGGPHVAEFSLVDEWRVSSLHLCGTCLAGSGDVQRVTFRAQDAQVLQRRAGGAVGYKEPVAAVNIRLDLWHSRVRLL